MNENPAEHNPTPTTLRWAPIVLIGAAIVVGALIVVTSLPTQEPLPIGGGPPMSTAGPNHPAPDARVETAPIVGTGAPLVGPSDAPVGADLPGHETRTVNEPPADLPVHENATLLLGIERRIPNWVEQQVVYRIDDASLEAAAVADWYAAAAAERGWTEKPTATASPTNRVLIADRRSMTITVRPTDRDVRVTFLYREAID